MFERITCLMVCLLVFLSANTGMKIKIKVYCIPELALNPLGQVVSHLYGKMLAVQCLHLVQRLTLQLLGLDPHCHGAPVAAE